MATILGKEQTNKQILPILIELLKDENSEVKLNSINGIVKIANVQGQDLLTQSFLTQL